MNPCPCPPALHDLDECVKYKVFSAKEVVSHQYWPSGTVHMTVTRFVDVDDGSGRKPVAARAAAVPPHNPAVLFDDFAADEPIADDSSAAPASVAGLSVVRPHDFDVCEDRDGGDDPYDSSDSEAREAAAAIAAVSSAAFADRPGRAGTVEPPSLNSTSQASQRHLTSDFFGRRL
jgi:hypothetical protein